VTTDAADPAAPKLIRVFIDLSDGISRTYDVSRYVIEAGVLRLFAPGPDGSGPSGDEIEVAAFAVGGWLRVERDLTGAIGWE
jgi:hypothetical protein